MMNRYEKMTGQYEARLKELAAKRPQVRVQLGGGMTMTGTLVDVDGLGRLVVETKTGNRMTVSKVEVL